jgi:hypothetical protein
VTPDEKDTSHKNFDNCDKQAATETPVMNVCGNIKVVKYGIVCPFQFDATAKEHWCYPRGMLTSVPSFHVTRWWEAMTHQPVSPLNID